MGDTCLDSKNEKAELIVFSWDKVSNVLIAHQLIPCTVHK